MKTVQQYRDFVRLATDADTDDLPDSLLDEWLQEGVQQIRQRATEWPWYKTKATTTTVASQATYSLPLDANNNTMRDIIYANGPYEPLVRLTEREAQSAFFVSHHTTALTGPPQAFSLWGTTLTLWPTPNAAYPITWYGYRDLDGWYVNAASVPDVPSVAEGCLNSWMLSRAFLHLSDVDLAVNHKQDFDERLARLAEDQLSASRWGPIVHGDRFVHWNRRRWPRYNVVGL